MGVQRPFDILLDQQSKEVVTPQTQKCNVVWIWYPGERAAHLQAHAIRRVKGSICHVSYPGNFRQPSTQTRFKHSFTLEEDTLAQWTTCNGRVRTRINGLEHTITTNQVLIPTGPVDVEMIIDFADTLPAVYFDCGSGSSSTIWQVSLDGKNWQAAEALQELTDPNDLPDTRQEITIPIPPANDKADFDLQAGESKTIDFHHLEIGSIGFTAYGEGEILVQVGESEAEVIDSTPEHLEQFLLPPVNASQEGTSCLLPERCIRWIRISSTDHCRIKNLRFEACVYGKKTIGHFECSDPLINQIWDASVATLRACTHDFYLDGLKRDRLPWTNDGISAAEAADRIFFDSTPVRNTILCQTLPENPQVSDLGITDYAMYTIMGFEHDYWMRMDKKFLLQFSDRINQLLALYASLLNEHYLLKAPPESQWGFLADWSMRSSGPDGGGIPCYAQMILMRCFEFGAQVAQMRDDDTTAQKWQDIAGKMRSAIQTFFWNDSTKAYMNGFHPNGQLDDQYTAFAQTWGILYGLINPQQHAYLVDDVFRNPACRATTTSFQASWEFRAAAKLGRVDHILDQLRITWGNQLERGMTRFAEDTDPQQSEAEFLSFYGRPFAKSLCHVWGGTAPIVGLSVGVLGIEATAPGWNRCTIHPQLGDLDWVKGSVPTPFGCIHIEVHKGESISLELPQGIIASVTETGQELKGPCKERISLQHRGNHE